MLKIVVDLLKQPKLKFNIKLAKLSLIKIVCLYLKKKILLRLRAPKSVWKLAAIFISASAIQKLSKSLCCNSTQQELEL